MHTEVHGMHTKRSMACTQLATSIEQLTGQQGGVSHPPTGEVSKPCATVCLARSGGVVCHAYPSPVCSSAASPACHGRVAKQVPQAVAPGQQGDAHEGGRDVAEGGQQADDAQGAGRACDALCHINGTTCHMLYAYMA